MNNNVGMAHDASSAFGLYLYLLNKSEEYSQTTLNVFDFASIKFCDFCSFLPNCEAKYTRSYKHFVIAKFHSFEMHNIVNDKQQFQERF